MKFMRWLHRQYWLPESVEYLIGRAACRLFHVHYAGCRGRSDHFTPDYKGIVDPGRWVN